MLLSFCSCSDTRSENLQRMLESLTEEADFGGVIRITRDGKTLCEIARGSTYSGADEQNTMDSRFCIGSVSKQFAAASIMLLKQKGLLSVDDKLKKYFPQYTIGKDITLKNLLTMRSGIAEFYGVHYINDAFTEIPTNDLEGVLTNKKTPGENREILKGWLFKQPLIFEPDSTYEYSNSNFFLLAEIVSQISGMEYEDFVKKNILEPLGMKQTGFIDDNTDFSGLSKPSVDTKSIYIGITQGLGDLYSCAGDMDKWLSSIWKHTLLTEESVQEMSQDYSPEEEYYYGYGINPDGEGGLFHTGFFSTYYAVDYTNPDEHINLFAVTNDETKMKSDLAELCYRLIDRLSNTNLR